MKIYTVGHSVHSIEMFLSLLSLHEITVVADVRSSPYSSRNMQFNREVLKRSLEKKNFKYVFLGDQLGARPKADDCYDEQGNVQYEKLKQQQFFKEGIGRLKEGMKEHTIALVCAEKDPIECHRMVLVSQALVEDVQENEKDSLKIYHILADGKTEEHKTSVNRLREKLNIFEQDLFEDNLEFNKQARRISYKREDVTSETDESWVGK